MLQPAFDSTGMTSVRNETGAPALSAATAEIGRVAIHTTASTARLENRNRLRLAQLCISAGSLIPIVQDRLSAQKVGE